MNLDPDQNEDPAVTVITVVAMDAVMSRAVIAVVVVIVVMPWPWF